jgi:hypothetical protein
LWGANLVKSIDLGQLSGLSDPAISSAASGSKPNRSLCAIGVSRYKAPGPG